MGLEPGLRLILRVISFYTKQVHQSPCWHSHPFSFHPIFTREFYQHNIYIHVPVQAIHRIAQSVHVLSFIASLRE